MSSTYDFIVVGAGPAGCAVARRLADSAKRPKVLLLEAGGDNRSGYRYRSGKLRFLVAQAQPKFAWDLSTAEEPYLYGRKLPQVRGKGLGGTSSINFSVWLVGSKDNYNEWAKLTGDNHWKWSKVQKRLRRIENVHEWQDAVPKALQYLDLAQHSTSGRVRLSFARVWDTNVDQATLDAARTMGLPLTKDLNSGNPIGMGLAPSTYANGLRFSAAEAYLDDAPKNLTVIPDVAVSRVLFEGKKAIGIETSEGLKLYANCDVILSAGALITPKILMLSGIGPESELRKHNIPIINPLPGVGRHLIDHLCAPITHLLTPSAASVANPQEPNPRHDIGPQVPIGFFRLPATSLTNSPEFRSLPPQTRQQLTLPTVPHYELMMTGHPFNLPSQIYRPKRSDRFRTIILNLMNLQSEGRITLSEDSPELDPPTIVANYLTHPFDQRLATIALREAMTFQSQPSFAATTAKLVLGPASTSDADLLAFWRAHAGSLFHQGGTVKMGRYDTTTATTNNNNNEEDKNDDDDMSCVDPSFRVRGVTGLRVVDLSVCPTLPCNHTQSTAYLIGETAAEKIVDEYSLGWRRGRDEVFSLGGDDDESEDGNGWRVRSNL